MNAHINLDLGIAAAKVMEGKDIQNLKDDFDKINDILSSLVTYVEQDLSNIVYTKKNTTMYGSIDDFLIDLCNSLGMVHEFANTFYYSKEHQVTLIRSRDQSVAKIGRLVSRGLIVGSFLK